MDVAILDMNSKNNKFVRGDIIQKHIDIMQVNSAWPSLIGRCSE